MFCKRYSAHRNHNPGLANVSGLGDLKQELELTLI